MPRRRTLGTLITIQLAEATRIIPKTCFCDFSKTEQVETMLLVIETPHDASAIIPDFVEIRSLAERAEIVAIESTDTPIWDVTA